MKLEQARRIGMVVVEMLAPACERERVGVAGSVLRGKAEPKDIEIVYIPRLVEERINLFEVAQVPATEGRIAELVRAGFWRFDVEVRRNGPKYKRLVHEASGMVVELFRAEMGNWGLVLALRTGPGDFNHLLVTRFRGAMPGNMVMRDGWLWRAGRRVETPTEEAFFEALGVPWWPPQERTVGRLGEWLVESRTHKGCYRA